MILIRPSLEAEHEAIRSLLHTNGFKHMVDEKVFNWQFNTNNYCKPIHEIAIDQSCNSIIGHYALMPLPFYYKGTTCYGGKIEGSAVHVDYRSNNITRKYPEFKGVKIFTLLIEEMRKEIKAREIDFVFGFPNERASRAQLDIFPDFSFQASYFVKVLDFRRALKARYNIRNSLLSKGLGILLGLFLDREKTSRMREYKTIVHTGFPDGIHKLSREFLNKSSLISIERTTNLIQWKYQDNPVKNYKFLSSYCNGELEGCLVYSICEENGLMHAGISDLIYDFEDTDALLRLLVSSLEIFRKNRADFVTFFTNKSSKLHTLFKALVRLGFIERVTRQNAFLNISEKICKDSDFIYDINNWYITSLFRQY